MFSYSQFLVFFFSSRRRHTRLVSDLSSDVCSSDLVELVAARNAAGVEVSDPVDVFLNGADEIGRASCRERVWLSGVYVCYESRSYLKANTCRSGKENS